MNVASEIQALLGDAKKIVIMQADNPDGDSLGSALALEHIVADMGKEPYLYCGVHIPDYLHHLDGHDRVSDQIPRDFDLSIIVDTSADSLFGTLKQSGQEHLIASKPCIVLDHHDVTPSIKYATIVHNPAAVATGEVIYELARQLEWSLSPDAKSMIASAILSDSLGLITEATSARSIHIIGELVDSGVSLATLDYKRRELMRKSPEIVAYKGRLLQRIEYAADGRVASITFPWEEIQKYSHEYNPSMLVLDDMRFVMGVDVVVAFKLYADGRVTGKIRCNFGKPIAGELSKHFGGGGHAYASGFKITDGRLLADIKQECFAKAEQLLDALTRDTI